MDRDLKETYDVLYNTSLKKLEDNLDRFIEAKHENLKSKIKEFQNENHRH